MVPENFVFVLPTLIVSIGFYKSGIDVSQTFVIYSKYCTVIEDRPILFVEYG